MRIDLIKKIAKHAYGGVEHERDNAMRKLEQLLAKEGLSINDLDSILREHELMWASFEYESIYEKKLIGQCVCHLMNTLHVANKTTQDTVAFKLPTGRVAEIRSFVDRVIESYRTELNHFNLAFLYKQGLTIEVDTEEDKAVAQDKKKDNGEVTQEDINAIRKMMDCIGKIQHVKMLEAEKKK